MAAVRLYPKGSEWRKWDLHVHPPFGKLSDGYKAGEGEDILEKFCDAIEASDVMVFGITDYFSFESFKIFKAKFHEKYPSSEKRFFFNLELRLNEAINKEIEEVNVHLIFNPDCLDEVEKFLSRLSVVKTGKDEAPIMCSELGSGDFESATVTRDSIHEAFLKTFGPKAIRRDSLLIFTAANNDGIRPERGKKRKEGICDEIDKFSDGFFGGIQNSEHYLNEDRLEDDQTITKKPVVSGSDSHSFEDLDNFLGNRFVEETEENGKKSEKVIRDVTWIKADPTFEGLKQILYEPIPGERVFIGPVKPDQKDDYKVIRKIRFDNSDAFPEEIIFNGNLSSIIGSRSSGKSALLAYIAHSIDPSFVEGVVDGPGEGEDYHWENIDTAYSIEWENGESNVDSPGKVVYIPQNYLFEESKNPDEVKAKIEPILFRALPKFKEAYQQSETDVDSANREIRNQTENWFSLRNALDGVTLSLKDLGDKKAIEKEKTEVESEIQKFKEKHSLSDEDVKEYQRVSGEISGLETRIKQIEAELSKFSGVTENKGYFSALSVTLTPSLEGLPADLKNSIKEALKTDQNNIITAANKRVNEYKNAISKERVDSLEVIDKTKKDNKDLIDKYQKNLELEGLVNRVNALDESSKKINDKEKERNEIQNQIEMCVTTISTKLLERSSSLEALSSSMEEIEQSTLQGIEFGVEYGFDELVENVTRRINLKEKTDFVSGGELKIEEVRISPGKFLEAIYSGEQKVIAHSNKKDVAEDALALTEKVLFTAEMEGDKIGGFSEPTMTPGKRALFALRLILIESEDTWPLLIDQPEDDLDSRSIYDDVVPFLKEKKKERQIIMVTHNANLVVGSDSEQVIIANRNGDDRKNEDGKEFNYLSGSLEYTQEKNETSVDTLKSQGVSEHACEILDGGKTAFESRKNKYNIK